MRAALLCDSMRRRSDGFCHVWYLTLRSDVALQRCGQHRFSRAETDYPGGSHCRLPAAAAIARPAAGDGSRRTRSGTSDQPTSILQPPPISLAGVSAGDGSSSSSGRVEPLWFASAATSITEGLPLGNGRLGTIVYGGAWRDTLGLNEESIVAVSLGSSSQPAPKAQHPEIQQLLACP